MSLHTGDNILFTPTKGKKRKGTFKQFVSDSSCMILLEGDPFAVTVQTDQVAKETEPSACGNVPKKVLSKKEGSESRDQRTEKESNMTPTATAPPSAKELRKTAQALSIPGWEDMSRSEMAEAIKKAQKVSANGSAPAKKKSKKVKAEVSEAPAKTKKKSKKSKTKKVVEQEVSPVKAKAKKNGVKKAAKKSADAKASASKTGFTEKTVDKALGIKLNSGVAPKALPAEGENPFRKKSNMFKIAKLLLKGGKRRVLAEKLAESTEIHPYLKGEGEIDLNDFDKRLLLGAETMLTKFGYGIQRKGRGLDGTILVFRPGGEKDPRKKAKKK